MPMTDDEHTVRDDDREITFTGHLLGVSTSQDELEPRDRWTEIQIFETAANQFIVSIIGMSNRPGELQRYRTYVCEDAAAAVEALHQVDADGIKYLTGVARAAATAASIKSFVFRQAFMTQRVA